MDDKAYTCFYCHSILPYEVCISGTHFCLQATNAIEFWGNVVKIASTNSVDGQENDAPAEHTFKVEEEEAPIEAEVEEEMEENEENVIFPEIDTATHITETKMSDKSIDDTMIESQDIKSDVKPMNWKLKMIALVKQRPPLYDKRLPLSERTFPIRAKLWKEVYEGLNGLVPIELLPKRFKVLRDRYNKEVKRMKLGHPSRKQWSLFKYLTFLSSAKKKICVKKMSLVNGECKMEDMSDKMDITDKILLNVSDKSMDDDYKMSLELKKKFVQLVGERPPLYDCRLPRPVRVAENKVKLWREVYESLDGAIPLVDLPRKFKSLRDRYMKEKKKLANNEPPSNWPLMDSMTYLDDVAYIRSQDISHGDEHSNILLQDKRKKMNDEKKTGEGLLENLKGKGALSPLTNLSDRAHSPTDDIAAHDDVDIQMEDSDKLDKDSPCADSVKANSEASPALHSNSIRLKKLDILEALDNWTEDDFFGAYLVRLMKRIPIEDKLRLHVEIINMIKTCLKNQ